ncbi:single-stranded DNA-binding protein [Nocardioides zeae]|uniref:Single-stranded DNA-binding protein n=1 Tax=Nocardioides imazamoxiresistens TaxID=3231893 RepID=A0ABU3PRQ4_9ACTN|nr:single-stranded DNA-binding protein [Nocardioides zeae]MDT9591904.1 single-stranded DNA-binding protein [Nocardioides zeae]
MSTTHITVQGWVGSEVNYAVTPGGHAVATFRLGSTPQRQARDGSWQSGETNWFTVKTWRHVADHVHHSVLRGQPVVVTGRLLVDSWQRPDGSIATRQVVEATGLGHDLTKGTARFLRDAGAPAVVRREAPADDARDGARDDARDDEEAVAPGADGERAEPAERADAGGATGEAEAA